MREAVAEEVRAMAGRRGYKQVQIAAVIGESQSTVSRLLHGRKPFDIDHLAALAAEWDVPISKFLGAEGQMSAYFTPSMSDLVAA
jgi:transcriptional regulator with XRE-family HTH domain